MAILNPTSLTANLQVAAIRLDGETLGSVSLTLSPGQRVSRLINGWIPGAAEQAGGLVCRGRLQGTGGGSKGQVIST